MALVDDLQKYENQAGNESDFQNVADKNYNEKFNKTAKEEELADLNASWNTPYEGKNGEKVSDKSEDDAKNESSDSGEGSNEKVKDKEENPSSLYKAASEAMGMTGLSGKMMSRFLKGGPSGAVVGLMLLAVFGIGGGTGLISSSILINLKEIFHNDRADGTRTNIFFSRATVSHMIGAKGLPCTGIKIKCRASSMNEKQIQNLEKAGYKVEGKIVDADGKVTEDRYTTLDEKNKGSPSDNDGKEPAKKTDIKGKKVLVDKVTFPDGHVTTTGGGFIGYTKNKITARASFIKAFNPRSAFFLNDRFNGILEKTFHFSKATPIEGKTKAEIDKSFNEKSGGTTKEEAKSGKTPTKEQKTIQEEGKKTGGLKKVAAGSVGNMVGIAVSGICTAYNSTRVAVAALKLVRMYQLVSFALPWLQAADQIKDGGKIEPEVVDNLSSRLVSSEKNEKLTEDVTWNGKPYKKGAENPKFGLTATDSEGYKIAAYGDRANLQDFAKTWMIGGEKGSAAYKASDYLEKISTFNGAIQNTHNGKAIIRNVCKTMQNPVLATAGIVAILADCASVIVGNAQGLQGCGTAVGWVAAGVVTNLAISYFGNQMLTQGMKIAENFITGSDLNGVDAGDAIAAGAGAMLGTTATASGLRPSTSVAETQGYITRTDDINNQYIAAEIYNARDTPFDATNQYSFLGSIVKQIPVSTYSNQSIFNKLATILGVIPNSFKLATTSNAYALYSQPAFDQQERYDCKDKDLEAIGVIGDKFCSIATMMPNYELDQAEAEANGTSDVIDKVIDYMSKDQSKNETAGGTKDDSYEGDEDTSSKRSIDDDGKPIGDQYLKYLQYCTEARSTSSSETTWGGTKGADSYWGTTTKGVEEGSNRDQLWYTGEQCTKNTKMMQMFRMYTNICMQIATMQETTNCWSEESQQQSGLSTEPSPDGTCDSTGNTKNIYFCALKYDDYGYKYGGGHGDVPNAQEWINKFNGGAISKGTAILDCSGLVRMAFVEAMGVEDEAYVAPGGFASSAHWSAIPLEQAQQGDIVTSSGHVAIVESNDPGSKTFKIFDAETENAPIADQIRHSTQEYSKTIAAYRAKK